MGLVLLYKTIDYSSSTSTLRMRTLCCWKIGTFWLVRVSPGTCTVCTYAKGVDRARPSGHSRRGLGAIRAVCRAWRALIFVFSAGVDKTVSRGSFSRRYFVQVRILNLCKWCVLLIFIRIRVYTCIYTPGISYGNGTACHNSGFPAVQGHGQVWGTLSSKVGALRACAVCNAMLFLLK